MPLQMTASDLQALCTDPQESEETLQEFSKEEIQLALACGEVTPEQCLWMHACGQNWQIDVR